MGAELHDASFDHQYNFYPDQSLFYPEQSPTPIHNTDKLPMKQLWDMTIRSGRLTMKVIQCTNEIMVGTQLPRNPMLDTHSGSKHGEHVLLIFTCAKGSANPSTKVHILPWRIKPHIWHVLAFCYRCDAWCCLSCCLCNNVMEVYIHGELIGSVKQRWVTI